MEKYLGRYLSRDEIIHHKDQNRLNNKIKNLELYSKSQHSSIHIKEQIRDTKGQLI